MLVKYAVILKPGLKKISKKYIKSHVFIHLHSNISCFGSHNNPSFKIIDKANYKFDFKIKEALNINWRKPKI